MKNLFLILFLLLSHFSAYAVQIPYAQEKATGRIAHADTASKQRGPFICLECGNELQLKQGTILAPHFAHKSDPNSSCGGGGPESWQHQLAKQILSDDLGRWEFLENCSHCSRGFRTRSFSINDGHRGSIEHPYDRFFVDVMVLHNDVPVAALEVRHTHAVDEEKSHFFKDNRLPIIEVDATEVIEAQKDGSFRVTVLESGSCQPCQERERRRHLRPCLQCKKWDHKDNLSEIEAPPGHPYRTAFACANCTTECPTCETVITEEQLGKYKRCFTCNRKMKTWKDAVARAIAINSITRLRQLIASPPPSVENVSEAQATLEELELRLAREQETQRLAWKAEIAKAITDNDIIKLRQLIISAPQSIENTSEARSALQQMELRLAREQEAQRLARLKAEEEQRKVRQQQQKQYEELLEREQKQREEVQRQQEIQNQELRKQEQKQREEAERQQEIARKARANRIANEIFTKDLVSLSVPYAEKESVKRFGARWAGGDSWTVQAKHIRACSRWFRDDASIISRVEALLEQKRIGIKRKRENPALLKSAKDNHKISDFFKK